MSDENQNKEHWRARLEDPRSLPEACIQDKKATWQQLHARLQPRRKKNHTAWYWAAACLFALMALPLLIMDKKQPIFVKYPAVPPQVDKALVIQHLPTKETTIIRNPVLITHLEKSNQQGNQLTIKKLPLQLPLLTQLPLEAVNTIQPLINVSVFAPQPVIVVVENNTGLLPVKRLKVIHVNELGGTTANNYPMVQREDNDASMPKLINHEIFSNSGPGATGSGVHIFRSKNLPSN